MTMQRMLLIAFTLSISMINFQAYSAVKPATEAEIDKEIGELQEKLESDQLKEMNIEISSQNMMFEQFHAFSDKMEEAEKLENEEEHIRKRIDELLEQKRTLLKKKS